jgi:hypothetical protein
VKHTHKFKAGEIIVSHQTFLALPWPKMEWGQWVELEAGNKMLIERPGLNCLEQEWTGKEAHYIRVHCNGRRYLVHADNLLHCCKAVKE